MIFNEQSLNQMSDVRPLKPSCKNIVISEEIKFISYINEHF